MPEGFALLAMTLKGIGALSGSALALLVKKPKSLAEFVTRLGGSVLAGVLFSTPVREKLGWVATEEYVVASAAIAAFCSWWLLAAGVRFLEKLDWAKK